jgi:LPS export ABC transporter protein LptC
MTTPPAHRVHLRPLRTVRALRAAILVLLAGFTLALVVSYGRRQSKPQTTITMAQAAPTGTRPVLDQADEFAIQGSREGRPAFALRARTVTGFEGERKSLDGVDLTLYDESGSPITIGGRRGQFDAATRRAQLSGEVRITTGDGMRLATGTLYYDSDRDTIFTADDVTFSAPGLEGSGRGVNYRVAERLMKIPDRVEIRVVRPESGAQPVVITAGDLVASPDEGSLVFTDDVRLARGGDFLHAAYVKVTLDRERRDVQEIRAFGEVVVTLRGGGEAGRANELRADSVTGRFQADGLEAAEASGNCRFTTAEHTARSRTARFERAEDRIELRGDAVVTTARDRIAAQEIDLHPGRRELRASGEVRSVVVPGAGDRASAAPGFGGGAPISLQSRELVLWQDQGRAAYRGAARAWQEGQSLQAEEIVLDRPARTLRAATRVMARFTPARGRTAAGVRTATRPQPTSLYADTLVFDDARGVGEFRGNVRLTRQDATLTAAAMDAHLVEQGGERTVERIEAREAVAIRQGRSYGTAQVADYSVRDDLLVLRDEGGLAEVVDGATGRVLRGRALTFDLAGDRILTETARGGRTWITLKPDAKDVQPVEPKTSY